MRNSSIVKCMPLMVLSMAILFTNCSLNDKSGQDWSEKINLYVSSELGEYTSWGSAIYNGIKIKKNINDDWTIIPIGGIEGFSYEEGFSYLLRVEKIHIADPPADAPNIRYKLIKVLSKE